LLTRQPGNNGTPSASTTATGSHQNSWSNASALS